MKYQLPDDLKRHYFPCDKAQTLTSYRSCKRRCPDTYRQCWETRLREDLYRDCAIENERNARNYVVCSQCGAVCDIGRTFNRFICSECGNVEYCGAEQQKALLGDVYQAIDEHELFEMLQHVK